MSKPTSNRFPAQCVALSIALSLTLLLSACVGKPDTLEPVSPFSLNRYLGTWYEIARLDHSFERGMDNVTAQYSLNPNGSVYVLNRGYNSETEQFEEAEGTAKFVREANQGYLKVSFFWPFYGSYVVFGLDQEHYQYAFVSGPNTDYLWLLARTPTVAPEVLARFKQEASKAGFDTSKLIMVKHDHLTE